MKVTPYNNKDATISNLKRKIKELKIIKELRKQVKVNYVEIYKQL